MFDDNTRYREAIKDQMCRHRLKVLDKLSVIARPNYVESFSKMLSYCWAEGEPEAKKIACDLDLERIDFCAIDENEKEFEALFLEETERKLGEMMWENYA